jgi:hypothetical protein
MGNIVQVEPRAHAPIPAIIRSGNSLSDAIDLEGYDLKAVEMPVVWTSANAMTFQAAEKIGGTYQNVYDDAGNEVSVSASNSRCIKIGATLSKDLAGLRFLKIRSGTSASAVAAGADTTLLLLVQQGA